MKVRYCFTLVMVTLAFHAASCAFFFPFLVRGKVYMILVGVSNKWGFTSHR